MTNIGISAFIMIVQQHVKDGEIISAAQEKDLLELNMITLFQKFNKLYTKI